MTAFFISHSSRDNELAASLQRWLEHEGFVSVFLDFDPADGIPAGRRWEEELYSELRRADVVLFLATRAALDSKWCHSELVLARSLGRTIVPLLLEDGAHHPLVADTQWIRLDPNGVEAFRPLADALERLGGDALESLDWDRTLSPYPGLEAFDEDRAGIFFGRGAEISAVLDRLLLRNTQAPERLVVVAGASGAGKSSVVRAGVLPRLRRQEHHWVVIPPFRPGDRPMRRLAQSFSAAFEESSRDLGWREGLERLAGGPGALADLVDDLLNTAAAGGDAQVVLVIDQGEQLITQAASQERIAVLDLVFGALEQSPQLRVLVTLRSEYLTELVELTPFEGQAIPVVTIGRLTPERLAEVIEAPAQRAGITFEAGLVQRMIEEATNDTSAGGDPLPLLAFALRQVYERRTSPTLVTSEDYARAGGVVGALKTSADGVVERLRGRGIGDLVVPTLLQLVNVESDRPPTSRSLRRSDFEGDRNDVIDAFVEARLLTTEGVEPMVHVAHDALLREWPLLSRAIEQSADELLTRSRLRRDAREWQLARRDPSYLLGGKRLDAAIAALASPGWTVDPLVHEYVAESRRRARRATWRTRTFVGLAATVVLAGLGLATSYGVDRAREALHKGAARSELIPLGSFAIDEHEVTDVQFDLCVEEGRCSAPSDAGTQLEPPVAAGARAVVMIDAAQATDFCRWIGRRLPNADEAVRAARAKRVRRLLRGGVEWTSTKNGIAFKAVARDPDTGSIDLVDVNRAFRNLNLTFRCAV